MGQVVSISERGLTLDEKAEFDRTRAAMVRAFVRWIGTDPDPEMIAAEIEATRNQIVGISQLATKQ